MSHYIETSTKKEFKDLELHSNLLETIGQAGFKQITPIQELTFSPILDGKDIFAQAETGSGKTASFVIPILEQILRDEKTGNISAHESRYVVLSPTRELAQQTHKVFEQFGKSLEVSSCCIIGGESIDKQKEQISKGIHILVATPGRLTDLIKQKVVSLSHCKGVVFDEADRLFDMGFKKDIEFILSKATKERQLIMLSATSNQDVLRTAYKFNSMPLELRLNEDSLLVDHIDHKLAMISRDEKFALLINLLRQKEEAYAIVFCNTQFQTHSVAEWLIKMGFKAKPISGRMPQNKRTSLMEQFRSKEVTILVCTDVAARGLDIKNVNLVINYDLPQEAANYVHRIGRTGRAGEDGHAVSFCAYEDCEFLDPIYDLIKTKIEKLDLKNSDFATDLCKKPYIDRKTLKVTSSDSISNRTYSNKYEKKPRIRNNSTTQKQTTRTTYDNKRTEDSPQTPQVKTDRKFVEFTSYDLQAVSSKACTHFKLEDQSLLGFEVLNEGRKKYFIFGPKETKYKFFIKPMYKKLLLPYLINIIKLAKLSLFVKVSFKPSKTGKPASLFIDFSGKDEKQLTLNQFELLNAFEHLILTYLYSKVNLHKNLRIQVKCFLKNTNSIQKDDHGYLVKLATFAKKKVLDSKKSFKMKSLNPRERRVIHEFFQNEKNFETASIGDGRFKQIEVTLKD